MRCALQEAKSIAVTNERPGIGRKLLEHCIAEARAKGAASLFLGSNSKLENAVHLYEAMGFTHVPADEIPAMGYSRSNVFMNMKL